MAGTLTEEQYQQQQLNRQQKMAELLMAQGLQGQPAGQMISGRYVPNSWAQNLVPVAQMLTGAYLGKKGDEESLKLAEQLRGKEAQAVQDYMAALNPAQTELAGPTPTNAPLMTQNQPDYAKAFAAATSRYAPAPLQAAGYKMLEPITTKEGEKVIQRNLGGGGFSTIAEGAPKYHAPTSVDMGTLGTMLIYPDGKREMVQKGREGPAGQVLETENGPMLVNTRTAQAQPIMAGGQPVAGGKPLTEVQGNATAFGMRAKQSDAILKNLESKGVTNTGIIRSAVGGTLGLTPFVGEKLEQATHSAMNVLPSVLGGPNEKQQEVDAARRNFITAVLRKESGAAISPSEFYNEAQKYFPQVGDSQSVLKQKQEARDLAIKALEIQAGPSGAKQIKSVGTSQDQQALDWANSNPNDPRAVAIKKKLGVQ